MNSNSAEEVWQFFYYGAKRKTYLKNIQYCLITKIEIFESASVILYIIYLASLIIGKTKICAATYFTAAIWSFTSTEPNLRWISCKIFRPWNPLPLPSNRAMMMLSVSTSTESQSIRNLSVTCWLPGSSSLQHRHIGPKQERLKLWKKI